MKRQLNSIFTSFGKRLFIREVITVYEALIAMILSLSSVLFLCVNLVIGICEEIPNTEPALLIVSYDGFRPDYLNRNVTPNLNKFRTEGTTARYMNPVFPTKTFVNHFSIATVSVSFDYSTVNWFIVLIKCELSRFNLWIFDIRIKLDEIL